MGNKNQILKLIICEIKELLNKQNEIKLEFFRDGIYYLTLFGKRCFHYEEIIHKYQLSELVFKYFTYRIIQQSTDTINEQLLSEAVNQIIGRITNFSNNEYDFKNCYDTTQWLFNPTYILLSLGGDDRVTIDTTTYKNKYATGPLPYYDYQRSSCTSSSISSEAYIYAETLHFSLISKFLQGQLNNDELFMQLRHKVLNSFVPPHLIDGVGLVLSPSGTDIEFICTLLGVARAKELWPEESVQKVTVIVNAVNEVGSGTSLASNMEHFNGLTPKGIKVGGDKKLTLPHHIDVKMVSYNSRDKNGDVISAKQMEKSVYQAIDDAIAQQRIPVFHYVHASKTGVSIPGLAMTKELKSKYKEKIIIIVDAAQLRLKSDFIEDYLNLQFNLIVTGSKFVGAPPFCGALLINNMDHQSLIADTFFYPQDLALYFDQYCFPPEIKLSYRFQWINWGLYLRWMVALFEIHRYELVPEEFRDMVVQRWRERVIHLLKDTGDIEIVDEKGDDHLPKDESHLSQKNSVVTFIFKDSHLKTKEKLTKIHKMMVHNIGLKGHRCEIGQPVQTSIGEEKTFALRLALGAKNLYEAYHQGTQQDMNSAVDYLIEEDKKIINKLDEVLKNVK